MRALLAALVVGPLLLAGCAEEAPPRHLPMLEVLVDARGNTTIEFGEVLGSSAGTNVFPYRVDDPTKTVLADVPEDAGHLLLVRVAGETPALLADTTRAVAVRDGREDLPTLVQFAPEGNAFRVDVVQPGACHARVNSFPESDRDQSNLTEGDGPFRLPRLDPGDVVVVVFDNEEAPCADARVEVRMVGAWRVVPAP